MPAFKDYPADYSQSQLFPDNVFDLLPGDHDCFVYRDQDSAGLSASCSEDTRRHRGDQVSRLPSPFAGHELGRSHVRPPVVDA